jgi:curved DNA-binding protein CbpA
MTARSPLNHYEVLNVSPSDDVATIRRSYHQLARELHPDMRPKDAHAEEAMRLVNEAWSVLGDPNSRRAYDNDLLLGRYGTTQSGPFAPTYDSTDNHTPIHSSPLRVPLAAILIVTLLLIATITPFLSRH